MRNLVDWLAKRIHKDAAPVEPVEPVEPPPWDCKRRGCDTDYDRWEPTVTCRVCGRVWTRIGTLAPGQSVEIVATLPGADQGAREEPASEMRTGEEWRKLLYPDYVVLDADGWRSRGWNTQITQITQEEFLTAFLESTIVPGVTSGSQE